MDRQEKKFLVSSLDSTRSTLTALGAAEIAHVVSTHYYGKPEKLVTEKLVVYPDHCEIHIIKRSDGTITLSDPVPMKSKDAGLSWLKAHGYTACDVVVMDYAEYTYKDGTVGLYCINGVLNSVILSYPEQSYEQVIQELGLHDAPEIEMLFNEYLNKLGKLQTISLS